ncbi:MAG: hypothetical protein U9O50_03825 [Acidobacteriota bacterium]|nr:hypothetical protein [Acidobacteriota bacterium]
MKKDTALRVRTKVIGTGIKANRTPRVVAAPLPPFKPRNIGQLCPITCHVLAQKH